MYAMHSNSVDDCKDFYKLSGENVDSISVSKLQSPNAKIILLKIDMYIYYCIFGIWE